MTSYSHHALVMCHYIIQNIIETEVILTSLIPRLHLQRFGMWSLGNLGPWHFCGYSPRQRHIMAVRLDFHHVTVSRGHVASPSERSNARFSVALRDRPGHAGSRLPRRGIDLGVYVALRRNVQIPHAFFPWRYPM